MSDHKIKEMLHTIDKQATPKSISSGELLSNVYQQSSRQKKRRKNLSLAALLVFASSIGLLWIDQVRQTNKIVRESKTIEQLRYEISLLTQELNLTQQKVDEMLLAQRHKDRMNHLNAELESRVDPLLIIKQQDEETAETIYAQAKRKFNELNLKQSAIEDYIQVIHLFPDTPAADKARKELNDVETDQKGVFDEKKIQYSDFS